MKIYLIPILVPVLFSASGAMAAEGDDSFKLSGSIGVGALITDESGRAKDLAKYNEYRDLSTGAIGTFDIKGRGSNHYLDAFGENLGRDDQYLNLKGGQYTIFKYQLYDNRIIHNWAFDARAPYAGVGGTTLTGTFPNLNSGTWDNFDLQQRRNDLGGMFEMSNNSPWYVRVDANQVTDQGLKLIAGSNGTSPGNGFIDKPLPVDTTTKNVSVEGGYASKTAQLSASALYSKFSNSKDLLNWTNPYFGSQLDATTLAADSDYIRYGLNGVLKQLPMDSTLSGRVTYSTTTNSIPIASTALNTGGLYDATNPDRSVFGGNVVHKTASLSLFSNPTKDLDSRVYWNYFKKDNRSTHVTFVTPPTGLNCGGTSCLTETLDYKKTNLGLDVGFRINRANRVVVGYDFVDLERDRVDYDETKDKKASIEYKNTSLDALSARVKVQNLRRRSHFLEGNAGIDATDPEYLNRFVARYDASNMDQNLVKLGLDATPAEYWDVGFEFILKKNNYMDTVLGRTDDSRQEYYVSLGYGRMDKFRVMVFADVENVTNDSRHRNISTLAGSAYSPYTPPTTTNYNWDASNDDRSWAVGVGTDWAVSARTKFNTSIIAQRTTGTVNFTVQPGANPATPAVDIPNYDNTKKLTLNLKVTHTYTNAFDLTAGYAFERFRYDDIAYNGYQYVIGTGATSTSYLSGAYAFPDYTVHSVYMIGTYKF